MLVVRIISVFFISLLLSLNIAKGQTVDYTITSSGTSLTVKFKPSSDITSQKIIGTNVTIKYAKSNNVTLGTVTNHISGVSVSSQFGQADDPYDNTYWMEDFGSAPISAATQTYLSGVEYDLFTVAIEQTGYGTGSFSLVDDGLTNYSGCYIEFNGSAGDATDYATPFYGTGSSNTEVSTDATIGTAIVWIGTTTDWASTGNWTGGSIPNEFQGVSIPTSPAGGNFPQLSSSISLKYLELNSSSYIDINDQTLTITQDIAGSGTFKGSESSSLNYTGSTASTLSMNQDTTGSTNVLKNLTINNASGLTIGNATRVVGILTLTSGTVTSGGNLTMAAASKYQYGQVASSGTGTISGNMTVEKIVNDTNTGWRNFSLPLAGSLSGLSGMDLLYSSHGTANERNIFKWDASDAGSGSSVGWTSASSSDDETNGFLLYADRGAGTIHNIDTIISHTGTYEGGDFDFDFYTAVDPDGSGSDATGWNNVPNPWPSNIDIDQIFASSFFSGITYKAIHVWDAVSGQYIAKCSTSVSITNYNTNGGTTSTSILQPFQAFWVKSDLGGVGATQRTLPSSVRTTDTSGMGKYFKKNFELLRLNVFDKDSAWDQTVIYFADGATPDLDPAFDAYKLDSYNTSVPSVYSVAKDAKLAINALDENKFVHSVPLGFKTNKTGLVSFSVDLSELNPGVHVYLEDKLLGGYHNIKESAYTFTAGPMDSKDRFVLHFMPNALSTDQLITEQEGLKVSGNGVEVYAFVPERFANQTYQIVVTDMMGRLVYTSNNLELVEGANKLNIPVKNSAYYSVRISNASSSVSSKVFVK